jgi:hypothetical protein
LKDACGKIDKILNEDDSVEIPFDQLKILQKIPALTVNLISNDDKEYKVEIKKLLGVCPDDNKKYFYASGSTPVKICSLVK